jgi:hypothetical protein
MTPEQNGMPGGPLQLSGGPRASHISAKKRFHITRYAQHNTRLVFKVSFAGKDHRDAVLIRGGDDFIVFFRAARLNY